MIDINKLYRFDDETEKPLETLVTNGGMCGIFRTLGCIGDSLSSGEFQSRDADGKPGYHDLYEYSWGQYIAREAGLTAYNFSKGGMTAKVFIDSFGKSKGFYDSDKLCQAYIIAMGVNLSIIFCMRGSSCKRAIFSFFSAFNSSPDRFSV